MRMPSLMTLSLPRPSMDDAPRLKPRTWVRWLLLLCGALLAIGAVVLLARALTAEQRALEGMEPQARAVLFRETWEGFQAVCQPQAAPGLGGRCRQEALFLLKFPDCTAACRDQLDDVIRPTR
jgi:cytochrome b pre-mRNA-processing protein 3